MEINIDATDQIVGRMVSFAAKRALVGNTVNIFNCEKAVITGDKRMLLEKYKHRKELTHRKGPFYPTMPDRFVRRIVRGMLPYKQKKGSDALRRVMCYIGVPENFKGKKMQAPKGASIIERKAPKYVKVSEICRLIGGKE
jgi:large subunit ribosomal protein L13